MKRKILLVDDDASLLAMLGDFLESEGYDVTKAENGEKALAILRDSAYDLIVLDMMMPGIGGMGVLDRIMLPDGHFRFPVLVMTAKSMMAEYFADKQVDGFIAKPCDPEDLALEISRIIFQTAGQPQVQQFGIKPLVYVADSNLARRNAIDAALSDAGYDVSSYNTGAGLIEAAVARPPAFIAISILLSDQSADVITGLLKGMKTTSNVKIVVYGIGAPGIAIDKIAAVNARRCTVVSGHDADSVVLALAALVNG